MAKSSTVCAGIDVGKYKLDAALDGGTEQLQVDNTPEGHKALSLWLRQHRVKRAGIEASGGYEQEIVASLRDDGLTVICSSLRKYELMPSLGCNWPRMTRSMPR